LFNKEFKIQQIEVPKLYDYQLKAIEQMKKMEENPNCEGEFLYFEMGLGKTGNYRKNVNNLCSNYDNNL
jgi:hypothetical protein